MKGKQLGLILCFGTLMAGGCVSSVPDRSAASGGENGFTRDPNCLTETGSLIPPRASECTANGRSYSSKEIQETGTTSPGYALSLLDPSITKH